MSIQISVKGIFYLFIMKNNSEIKGKLLGKLYFKLFCLS